MRCPRNIGLIDQTEFDLMRAALKCESVCGRMIKWWMMITSDLNSSTPEKKHYDDVIMTTIASQVTSLTVVYSIVYSDADERKHQSSASLAFVWGIHRTGEFPAQRASYAENVSIWWRHHEWPLLWQTTTSNAFSWIKIIIMINWIGKTMCHLYAETWLVA